MITVSRLYKFSASHRLHVASLSDAENRAFFGKCDNPFGHGHNYELEVTVRGAIDRASGRVVDLARLDELIHQSIIRRYDHRYLNEELPEFESEVPTTENLGRQIEKRLTEAWPSTFPIQPALQGIRIFETERNIIQIDHENR